MEESVEFTVPGKFSLFGQTVFKKTRGCSESTSSEVTTATEASNEETADEQSFSFSFTRRRSYSFADSFRRHKRCASAGGKFVQSEDEADGFEFKRRHSLSWGALFRKKGRSRLSDSE